MLLPHDRVGSDFSWLQAQSQQESAVLKAEELEDEESFLYGNEDTGEKKTNKSSTTLFAAYKPQGMDSSGSQQNKPIFSSFGDMLDLKQTLQRTSSSVASASLDSSECEKIKNILKSLDTVDVGKIMGKMQGQKVEKQRSPAPSSSEQTAAALTLPELGNPNVRQALQSLQSLIKATKEKREQNDGSGTSQTSSDNHKARDNEEGKNDRQARMKKMESLMNELEGLLKQDGLSFLSPVIGFYCQKCEEFIGDLSSAETHAAIHHHGNSGSHKVRMDRNAEDSKGPSRHLSSSSAHPQPSERRDHRGSEYRESAEHRSHRDHQQDPQRDWRDDRDHRNKNHNEGGSHGDAMGNMSLKQEMRKERLLITVSRGQTPPPKGRAKKEVNKEQNIGSHNKIKVEDTDCKGNQSNSSGKKKGLVKYESSDSSDDDKGKTQKDKSPKKKKKKKKDKKKKKEKS
ncbi:zinc finger protein 318-like [Notothenia coriiceps]|uniref:Zinc finger protein 318-like n=1 Tax=Notothenia coriiceps TaxID=8208 RepID=A0A6I9NTY5_9TELE|nr:PREDICTED: zinc finger protein 318-like [Notothenia coriiceps]